MFSSEWWYQVHRRTHIASACEEFPALFDGLLPAEIMCVMQLARGSDTNPDSRWHVSKAFSQVYRGDEVLTEYDAGRALWLLTTRGSDAWDSEPF